MTNEQLYDDRGKARSKPEREPAALQKDNETPDLDQVHKQPDAANIRQMQRAVGNAAVQRMLAQRQGKGPLELDEETADEIQARRGHGQKLDPEVGEKATQTMGHDFDGVNVHTDAEANRLSSQLGAKAFTTGNDIFFRQGAYNPASSDGQRLIAHELTHVVQQGATPPSVQGKMTVNDPDDQYEAEADRVADAVVSQEASAQRQELPEEEEPVQMQADETVEEEELSG